MKSNRRDFLRTAAALGAVLAWGGPARASRVAWREREDLYPEGVASGDPDAHSVILWTRRPYAAGGRRMLSVEVAEDPDFRRVVARARTPVSAKADWTTRVLVGGNAWLDPRARSDLHSRLRAYWRDHWRRTTVDYNSDACLVGRYWSRRAVHFCDRKAVL